MENNCCWPKVKGVLFIPNNADQKCVKDFLAKPTKQKAKALGVIIQKTKDERAT